MDKSQYEIFLMHASSDLETAKLIKAEPSLFRNTTIPTTNNICLSDVNNADGLSDYYNNNNKDNETDPDKNFNVFLLNQGIIFTESTTLDDVDVLCIPSANNNDVLVAYGEGREEDEKNAKNHVDQLIVAGENHKIIDEIFIDIMKSEQSIQFLATDALAELDLDDNDRTGCICTGCQGKFDTEEALGLHQFNCSEILKEFLKVSSKHPVINPSSTISNENSNNAYECFQLNNTFKNAANLTKHKNTQHQQSLQLDSNFHKDIQEFSFKSYACRMCNLKFNREKALIAHERFHETEKYLSSSVDGVLNCKNCGKNFSRPRLFDHHFAKCIGSQSSRCLTTKKKPNTIIGGNNNFSSITASSTIVGKIGTDADVPVTTTIAATSTTKLNQYPCAQCSKMFATRQKMFRHMWIHRKKMFSCEVCAVSFGEQHELDEHRLSRHAEVSPFVCSECGKHFASRQGLWEHNRIHSQLATIIFTCDQCGKTFASRQGYLIHNRTHTGEKPFQCGYCDKSFRDGGTLRKHQRIHTGERPHKCALCAKSFTQKVVLREHYRWVHISNKCEYPEPSPYNCMLCGTGHTDREELCMHLVKHSDQIVAFNKENAKQQHQQKHLDNSDKNDKSTNLVNDSGTIKSNLDLAEIKSAALRRDCIPNDGVKYVQKVVENNRIILRQYSDLYKQLDSTIISPTPTQTTIAIKNNTSNTAQQLIAPTAVGVDDTTYSMIRPTPALVYVCQMCGTTFEQHQYLMQHIKSHI